MLPGWFDFKLAFGYTRTLPISKGVHGHTLREMKRTFVNNVSDEGVDALNCIGSLLLQTDSVQRITAGYYRCHQTVEQDELIFALCQLAALISVRLVALTEAMQCKWLTNSRRSVIRTCWWSGDVNTIFLACVTSMLVKYVSSSPQQCQLWTVLVTDRCQVKTWWHRIESFRRHFDIIMSS